MVTDVVLRRRVWMLASKFWGHLIPWAVGLHNYKKWVYTRKTDDDANGNPYANFQNHK